MQTSPGPRRRMRRRGFLSAIAASGAALGFPHVWLPSPVRAATGASGTVKHLIYIRLSGGFRFPCAYNADVADQFNPFGRAAGVPSGVEWTPSQLLERAPYLQGQDPDADSGAGPTMKPVHQLADRITVMPTVDHEPLAGRADGNHETGLERYLTGFVNGEAGLFTRLNRGLKRRYSDALSEGRIILPPFVMGSAGMARGLGDFAPHRPPVLGGASFDQFAAGEGGPPNWAEAMVTETDARMRDRQHPLLRDRIDAFIRTREATKAYTEIFASDVLKVDQGSDESFDGISNNALMSLFGDSRESRDLRLALRLFHYGCPAVYLDQGGYDHHSSEENELPGDMERANRMLSALAAALPAMNHPDGGTYWDHTVVVLGSEFSRTARGNRFNSARGSDHNGDNSTRWMSMPFMGGPIRGGRVVGATTRASDLEPEGTVYSYRAMFNTLMDGLGCDPEVFFPGDDVVPNLLGA